MGTVALGVIVAALVAVVAVVVVWTGRTISEARARRREEQREASPPAPSPVEIVEIAEDEAFGPNRLYGEQVVTPFEAVPRYGRPTMANEHILRYLLEHAPPEGEGGCSDVEVMDALGLGAMQQGRFFISMKDAIGLGYVEDLAPRLEQRRYRLTEHGRQRLEEL